jgi:beta-hydroxylase
MSFINPSPLTIFSPLTEHWIEIRDEYDRVIPDTTSWHESIHNGRWDVIGLRFQGLDLVSLDYAPTTYSLCSVIPGIDTFGFSILRPGCEIIPHRGYSNKLIRIHLGLYTNGNAKIRVGNQEASWHDGELLIFDDTQVHSAWNHGNNDRVILLLDVARSSIESYFEYPK